VKIWAHRGCSQLYPENTITSFDKAAQLYERGLTGIELDVQLTRDGDLVVIHDERIDRTTDGSGFVRDFTLKELKTFHIHKGEEEAERIPTLKEVLELLEEKMKRGLLLNIELKNSVCPYPGMEEKTYRLVESFGLNDRVVYSSFYARSLQTMHDIDPGLSLGVLDTKVSDCLFKHKGLGIKGALHPSGHGIDIPPDDLKGLTVRAWFGGHLYPEKPTGGRMDLKALEAKGITDVFMNEPEKYLE
jgi:hypothetical protein